MTDERGRRSLVPKPQAAVNPLAAGPDAGNKPSSFAQVFGADSTNTLEVYNKVDLVEDSPGIETKKEHDE